VKAGRKRTGNDIKIPSLEFLFLRPSIHSLFKLKKKFILFIVRYLGATSLPPKYQIMQITTHPAPSNTKIRILSATSFRAHILLFAFAFFLKNKKYSAYFSSAE
jgi:hypothetical protein